MAIKDKDRVHPYSSGDPNGQREDQVIVPLSLVKSLFMEKACPDTAGPCVRHMHKVETMLPGSVVQTIALLKQRHAPNGLQLVRPIKGQVYDAVYETDEMVRLIHLCADYLDSDPFGRCTNYQKRLQVLNYHKHDSKKVPYIQDFSIERDLRLLTIL